MLGQRRLELDRVELALALAQLHYRALRLQVEKNRKPASLEIEVHNGHTLVERIAQCEPHVRRQAGYTDSPDRADERDDHAARLTLCPAPRLAYLEQRTRGIPGVHRQEQELVGACAQNPTHQNR